MTDTYADPGIEAFCTRDVHIDVVGITPYSASRPVREKEKSESWDDYEAAVWRLKAHEEDGKIIIPGSAFKLSLDEAVQNLNEKIPGKGNQTWTGVLKMGVAPLTNMALGTPVDKLMAERAANAGRERASCAGFRSSTIGPAASRSEFSTTT